MSFAVLLGLVLSEREDEEMSLVVIGVRNGEEEGCEEVAEAKREERFGGKLSSRRTRCWSLHLGREKNAGFACRVN